MGLQLYAGTLSQVPRHVSKRLGSALAVVTVVSGECADQLLGGPLAMLRGQPRGQAAGRQSIGQLQRPYSGGIMGRMGI